MKRLAILVGALALTTTTFAQKATSDNPFSLEGAINLNTGNGLSWQSPTIRARYFVNDNIAVRASVGIGDGLGTPSSEHYDFNSHLNSDSSAVNQLGTLDIKRMNWNAQIGGEYHLDGTDRISPYFMLGINFGGGSSSMSAVESDGSMYVEGLGIESEGKMSMFGVGLGAGLDVYIIENVYIGFELGFNWASYNYKDMTQTTTFTAAGTTTITNTFDDNSKMSYMSTGAGTAAVRFGWRF